MKYFLLAIYIGLGLLDLFIVKNSIFLLVLVSLFEAVRLVAVWNQVKPVVIILAFFNIGFLGMNYHTFYDSKNTVVELSKDLAMNMGHYSKSYWTSQDKYMEMVSKQETLIENIDKNQLPTPEMVWLLIALMELSLAYMVSMKGNAKTPTPVKKEEQEFPNKNDKSETFPSPIVFPIETKEKIPNTSTMGIPTIEIPKNSHEENKETQEVDNKKSHNGNIIETKNSHENSQKSHQFSQISQPKNSVGKNENGNNGNLQQSKLTQCKLKSAERSEANFPTLFPAENIPNFPIPTDLKFHTLGKGSDREYYKGDKKIPKSTYYRDKKELEPINA
jgi:hypothetical protein